VAQRPDREDHRARRISGCNVDNSVGRHIAERLGKDRGAFSEYMENRAASVVDHHRQHKRPRTGKSLSNESLRTVILTFPARREKASCCPRLLEEPSSTLGIPWWDVRRLRERLTFDTSDEEYRMLLCAEHRGALLMPCPHLKCSAAAGEKCQSESGRIQQEPHSSRISAWTGLSLDVRARMATASTIAAGGHAVR
jgi:hypothetical protein